MKIFKRLISYIRLVDSLLASTCNKETRRGQLFCPLNLTSIFPGYFNSIFLKLLVQTEGRIMGKSGGGYYAVARGKQIGIFKTWDECKKQVHGFAKARFKKFSTKLEAENFVQKEQEMLVPQAPSSSFHKTVSSANVVTGENNRMISLTFAAPSRLPCRSAILINPINPTSLSADTNPENVSGTSTGGLKRSFSTTAILDKRSLKVTEDRVTGTKRMKMDPAVNAGVDLTKFQVDEEGYVQVFTDGACSSNGRRGAKAGIGVFFGDDNLLNISEPVQGRQTNNTAEIQAAEKAIVQAKSAGITKLKLLTDSQFTINCVTKWLYNWKRNGWKLTSGKNVQNRVDLEKLDLAIKGIEIKWSYIQAHRGHYGNECADRLAVAGANKSKK